MSAGFKCRLTVDLAMIVLMLPAMAYQLTGNLPHEVLGMVLLGLFLLHHWLNRRWFAALAKGRYTARRILSTTLDLLLMATMFMMMITGILLSRDLLPIFPFADDFLMRQLHTFSANWGLILMSAHFGLHWTALMRSLRKVVGVRAGNRWVKWALRALTLVIVAWGIRSFYALALDAKLTMYFAFGYWDFKTNAPGFFFAYLSVFCSSAALTHYASRLLGPKKNPSSCQERTN